MKSRRCVIVAGCLMLAFPREHEAQAPVDATPSAYKIEYSNTTLSDLRALFGIDTTASASTLVQNIRSELSADLFQTPLARTHDVVTDWRLRNVHVHLVINGVDAIDAARSIESGLSKPMVVTTTASGRVTSIQFAPSLDEPSKAFARAIIGAIQFAPPRPMKDSIEESREDDQAGSYIARYRRDPNMRTFSRTRVRYLPQAPIRKGEVGVTQTIEPHGTTRAVIAADGTIVSLDGNETQRVSVATKRIATGSTVVRMYLTAREAVTPQALGLMRSSARGGGASAEALFSTSDASGDSTISRNELGNETAEDLLTQLARVERTATDSTNPTGLYLKFKALVYLHPEASSELGKVLRGAAPNRPTMLLLSEALGAVGHRQAQAALAEAIDARRSEWSALSTLIPVLGGVRSPTKSSVNLIMRIAAESTNPQIASTARLAAGTMAHNAAPDSPLLARSIVSLLIAGLASSTASAEKRDFLLALGNSGSTLALSAIKKFVHDDQTAVRSAAIVALRWIDRPEVVTILIDGLATAIDPAVRLAAARSLAEHTMTPASFAAQKTAFSVDSSTAVRVAVLQNLWNARDGFPGVRLIVSQAAGDSARNVRDAALRMR